MTNPYAGWVSAGVALDAVEKWIGNQGVVLREFGGLIGLEYTSSGRIDAIVVPTGRGFPSIKQQTGLHFWERYGLVSVEVKVKRPDFLKGLREDQYDRYAKTLTGLYIAAPRSVCTTSEIPAPIGHLVISRRRDYGTVAVCRRHPKWNESAQIEPELLWRVVLRIADEYRRKAEEDRYERRFFNERFGNEIGRRLWTPISGIIHNIEQDLEKEQSK